MENGLMLATNDMRNLANFHQSMFKSLKTESLIKRRKCMNLKGTEELCIMIMKNGTKVEETLTCQFKIDMKNLTNFALSTQKSQKLAP